MLFVLQALQEKHRKENWNKPIRNPDKPTRRSDEGGSGTPLAATMQSLVWSEDYPSGAERGNLRSSAHRVDTTINMDDLPRGFAKPIR
jgi:hypothetical protein